MIDEMLDPITALSLASNVIQLIDFTAKVLRKKSVRGRKQDLVDHARLTVITSDLRNQTENLKDSLFFKEKSDESDENGKVMLHKYIQVSPPRTISITHPGPGIERHCRSVRWRCRRTPRTPEQTQTTRWPHPMGELSPCGYIGLE